MSDKKTKEGETKKVDMSKGIGKFTLFLILAVLFWNTVQIWMMSSVVARVDKYNEGAVIEAGKMMGDVKLFAEDLNQIRQFLLLPKRNYSVTEGVGDGESQDEEEIGKDSSKGLYAFLDQLKLQQKIDENRIAALPVFERLILNIDFWAALTESDLKMGERIDMQLKVLDSRAQNADGSKNILNGEPLFSVVFVPEENLFRVQSAIGDEDFANYSEEIFVMDLQEYFLTNADAARQKKIEQKEQEKSDQQKAEDAVKQAELDKYKELDDLVADVAFVDTLQGMGFSVKDGTREEVNKRLYDIVDEVGKVQFSVALELSSGMIKIIRDNQEFDIESFLTEGSKKKS